MSSDHVGGNGWIGERLPRLEDRALVAGLGIFVDDLPQAGALHMAVLRSPHAHARITSVDTSAALAMPGVHAVLSAGEVRARSDPLEPLRILPGQRDPLTYALAWDFVRHVGEPVAVLAADDRYVAEDALELIEVGYEPLEPILDVESALLDASPRLYEHWPDNVQFRVRLSSGDVEQAIGGCDLVMHERLRIQRQAGTPLEGRGVLAVWDAAERVLTIHSSSQQIHSLQTMLARSLRLPEARIRVIAPRLGGGFGVKTDLHREDVLAALLAIQCGRPIRWIEDRREHFLGSVHAREQLHDVTIGARSDGRLVVFQDRVLADLGSRSHTSGQNSAAVTVRMLPGPYHFTAYDVEAVGVVTNKVPAGSYRGYGNPEANFVLERCVDLVARRLGLDPAEVRRRNIVRPEELPFTTPTGQRLDSGDYPAALDLALKLAGYDEIRERREDWRRSGRSVGVGMAVYVEATGLPGTAPEPAAGPEGAAAGYERAVLTMDQHAHVTVYSGLMDMGQGLSTAFRQIAAQGLGVSADAVQVVLGDTTVCPYSPGGSSASRSLIMGGNAISAAAARMSAKLARLAGHTLEAAPEDLEREAGQFHVRGAPDRCVGLLELARIAHSPSYLPPDEEIGLMESGTHATTARPYAYGAHVAIVEVAKDTGRVDILTYAVADDCGVVVNPMIVEGQVHGGIAQGLAGALLEELVFDDGGQLATASLMDYLLPTALDMPTILLGHLETPSPVNRLGVRGVGESGTIPPAAAIVNAIADALRPLNVQLRATPATPARVWQALSTAERG